MTKRNGNWRPQIRKGVFLISAKFSQLQLSQAFQETMSISCFITQLINGNHYIFVDRFTNMILKTWPFSTVSFTYGTQKGFGISPLMIGFKMLVKIAYCSIGLQFRTFPTVTKRIELFKNKSQLLGLFTFNKNENKLWFLNNSHPNMSKVSGSWKKNRFWWFWGIKAKK